MRKKTGFGFFFGFLLIPIISGALWSLYYKIDQPSLIQLVKLMVPISVGLYFVGEILLLLILPRLSRVFKFGFWLGFFFLSPFYFYQFANMGLGVFNKFPTPVLYVIYIIASLLASMAIGWIFLAVYDLIVNIKNYEKPGPQALKRLVLILVSLAILFPIFAKNRSAQGDLVKKRVSYRAFTSRQLEGQPTHKVMALGVDGMDWNVATPLVEKGKMPNLKKLMSEGRWGTLESEKPMRSPTLWTTIFTGQPPQKHGVNDWIISYSKNRLVKAVWNILSEYSLRTTMINVPGTFPPEEITGKLISGFPYPNPTMNVYGWLLSSNPIPMKYTPTAPLEMKLDADGSYRGTISVSTVLVDKYMNGTKGKNFKNMWIEYMLKTKQGEIYGSAIPVARYRYFDKEKRLDIFPLKGEETPIASIKEGEWSGFFVVPLQPGLIAKAEIRAIKLSEKSIILYMTPFFSPSESPKFPYTFPAKLAEDITNLYGQYTVEMTWMSAQDVILVPSIEELSFQVEDVKSKVGKTLFDEKEWDLFIQVFCLTDRMQHSTWAYKYDPATAEILSGTPDDEKLKVESTTIEDAYIKADNWIGSLLDDTDPAQDVILLVSDHGFEQGTGRDLNLGMHRLEGSYVVWGGPVKPIKKGDYESNKSDKHSISDVTRNILYMMGLPVGKDMIGKVWIDLYDESYVSANPVKEIDTYDSAEEVKGTQQNVDPSTLEQLKGLGYIDGGNVEGN